MEKLLRYSLVSIVSGLSPILSQATNFTEKAHTQARGSAIENAQTFSLAPIILAPIIDGFSAPARAVGLKSTGDDDRFFDWRKL